MIGAYMHVCIVPVGRSLCGFSEYCSTQGTIEIELKLIGFNRKGSAIEATDGDGQTPLHDAAWNRQAAVVELLLWKGVLL